MLDEKWRSGTSSNLVAIQERKSFTSLKSNGKARDIEDYDPQKPSIVFLEKF
jgi:hypothetical protein